MDVSESNFLGIHQWFINQNEDQIVNPNWNIKFHSLKNLRYIDTVVSSWPTPTNRIVRKVQLRSH